MTKQQIVEIFIKKGILSSMSGLVRRPFCWKKRVDKEAETIFAEFCTGYRSEEEAWFCLCRNVEAHICPVCRKEKVKFTGITKNGGSGFKTTCEQCSANAVQEKIQKTKKYHKELSRKRKNKIIEKRRATNQERYGAPDYMCYGSKSFKRLMQIRFGSESFTDRTKARKTCMERYGVPTNLLIEKNKMKAIVKSWSSECRKKRIANCIEKTGKKYYTQVQAVKERMKKTKRDNIRTIEKKYDCRLLADITRQYGQGYKNLGLEYLRFGMNVFVQNKDIPTIIEYTRGGTHTNKYTSKTEKEVLEFIQSVYTGAIEENCTAVVPNGNHRFFELDIYLPEIKLGIEYNGVYWHSTKYKDKFYHQRKTRCCRAVGIQVIHIFEDVWKENNELCREIITKCIEGQFKNEISKNGEVIVGDNSYPIPQHAKILEVTRPQKHQIGKLSYYDSGRVIYTLKGELK